MTKNRLELFTDGVFAIVLTLLVLDLKVPPAHGLGGVMQIVPALTVHAATFFIVGVLWMIHHGAIERVVEVNRRTLGFKRTGGVSWARNSFRMAMRILS